MLCNKCQTGRLKPGPHPLDESLIAWKCRSCGHETVTSATSNAQVRRIASLLRGTAEDKREEGY